MLVIAALTATASVQASYWRDSETLWRHTLAVTTRNSVAHTNLGNLLPAREALPQYEAALAIEPGFAAAVQQHRLDSRHRARRSAARWCARGAVGGKRQSRFWRRDPMILRTLAVSYAEAGRFDDAIRDRGASAPIGRGVRQIPRSPSICATTSLAIAIESPCATNR